MITMHRIGLVSLLAVGLALNGCAKLQSEMAQGWTATFAPVPKLHRQGAHRHRTRVFQHAGESETTGSVTPIAMPALPENVLQACKRHLYLDTATSTDEIRVAEAACKDIIVNQPIGGVN
jgi:hypothetical protein